MKFLTSLVVIYLDLEHPMTCICSGIPPPLKKNKQKKQAHTTNTSAVNKLLLIG